MVHTPICPNHAAITLGVLQHSGNEVSLATDNIYGMKSVSGFSGFYSLEGREDPVLILAEEIGRYLVESRGQC